MTKASLGCSMRCRRRLCRYTRRMGTSVVMMDQSTTLLNPGVNYFLYEY